jgi:hypothetical protein
MQILDTILTSLAGKGGVIGGVLMALTAFKVLNTVVQALIKRFRTI